MKGGVSKPGGQRSNAYVLCAAERTEIAAVFCDCDAHRGPQKAQRFPRHEKGMLHCDLRVRWKVASDLRFRAAISEPETPFFLRDFSRFGSVNAEIASDCDCAILVR